MKFEPPPAASTNLEAAHALRNWVMVALTAVFVLLYGAALLGLIKPLADERVVARLEPIIFVIIGYYFGRLPGQQNEQTLKHELNRQTQKAEAAQHAKEQAQQAREALEEKVKNVRAAFNSSVSKKLVNSTMAEEHRDSALRQTLVVALDVLNS